MEAMWRNTLILAILAALIQLSDAYTYYATTTTYYYYDFWWFWLLISVGIIVFISLLIVCLSYACKTHNRGHVMVHPPMANTVIASGNMPPPYSQGMQVAYPHAFAQPHFATNSSGMPAAPLPPVLYPKEQPPSYGLAA